MTTITDKPTAVPPPTEPPSGGKRELRPILASWLKDSGEFTEKVTDTSKRAVHTTAWHVLHSPLHFLRAVRYAPVGLWRVTSKAWGWINHSEVRPMQRTHALANNSAEWHKLEKERKERVHRRWIFAMWIVAVSLVIGALWWWLMPRWELTSWPVVWVLTPYWTLALLGFAAVWPLGYYGRPVDAPLIKRATDTSGNPPLRSETVVNALVSLRIPGMTKPDDIRLLHDVSGPSSGYLFEMELPPGVTAEAVMEKRPEMSAALRHPLGCVWPSVGKRHQGHLVLFVSHEDMNSVRQKPWPLLKIGTVDVFSPQPLFTDQRNRWVNLTLAYTSGVIGAVPRMGKTFILRELLLVAALDPRCKIYAFDLKGTGDLSPVRTVAHRYECTARPEKIADLLPIFDELQKEMYRRAEVIEKLPYEVCPENKVTPALASRRDLKLEPILIGVDECHELFEHEDAAVRNQFIKICTDLVKRGPALGIMLYLATQKPSAASIPTAIADNAVIRVCLKVHNQVSNDQVLGTGSSKMGLKAQLFAFADKGIAYLKGEGADAQIVRSVFGLDAPASEKVAARAYAERELQGRLTGDAAGEEMEQEVAQVVLLDDIKRVFGAAAVMDVNSIAAGLAELRPELHGGLDSKTLPPQLRRMEVKVEKIHVPALGKSALAVRREWLNVSTTRLVGGEEPGDNVVSLTKRR
ncbi:MAG TPA: FtsK/SpoIIIE domain-containing protein [Pseudonocardiaceae bacterium]|nr:FtsK/SpoIIIE domain-containing protein [Pseudonocardiaceae bacterium]